MFTKKEKFQFILEVFSKGIDEVAEDDKEIVCEFCKNEIERLEKGKKPTKTQIENAAIKDEIVNYLAECGRQETATQIWKAAFSEISVHKITQLLSILADEGRIYRIKEGRNPALYSISETAIEA